MPRSVLLALIASIVLTGVVYWIGLSGPLVFDDAQNLLPLNDWLQGRSGWWSVVLDNRSGPAGRPLSMASFVLNIAIGGPSIWSLKLGNLLVHLISGGVLFLLLRAIIEAGGLDGDNQHASPWWAWLATGVWLLHPLLASTVLYVVQRMAMLSALFTLLAMLSYLRGRLALRAGRHRCGLLLLLVAVPLWTVLATLSKENGVLAPALCALLELFVFQPAAGKPRSRAAKTFIALTLFLPALAAIVLTLAQAPFITAGYDNRPFTLGQRLLTEARVLWDYVAAILMPGGARLGVYHDDFPLSTGLMDPPTTLLALLAWPLVAGLTWRLRRTIPAVGLGLGIFLVGQSIESSVFPLLIYFEHRNYLPAIGVIWAVTGIIAFGVERVRARIDHPRPIFAVAAGALVLLLAGATHARAYVWANAGRLLSQAYVAHPDSDWVKVELIAHAMSRQPPAYANARGYAQSLGRSSDPETRRLGAVEEVLIACAAGTAPDGRAIDAMFAGTPRRIDIVLMQAFEGLSDGVAQTPCPGLSTTDLANGLTALLDRAGLPPARLEVWHLRYRTANLYAAGGDMAKAIEQARLAYADGAAQPQVTLYLARLLLEAGDLAGARRMTDALAAQIRPSDYLAQQQLRDLRSRLQQ